ncbi:hypothetical protein KJ830_01950 [bacterium]|nr:hypothetical protein [bacterium]
MTEKIKNFQDLSLGLTCRMVDWQTGRLIHCLKSLKIGNINNKRSYINYY